MSPSPASSRSALERGRAVLAAVWAAVLGAAPHVLHHAGPLAGAAILAGTTGKLVFGIIGLLLAVPMLRRLRRRTGSWRVPAGILAVMAVVFAFSAFVLGPLLTGGGSESPGKADPTAPAPTGHDAHHP